MGKVRTRILGLEDVEEKQKKKQKIKATEKKVKKAVETPQETKEIKGKTPEVAGEEEKKEKASLDKIPDKQDKKAKGKKPQAPRKRGIRYMSNKRLVDKGKKLKVSEAIALLKKMKPASFDETVELHVNVEKQGLKGDVALPHSTGRKVRVRIVDDATITEIQKGKIDFDVLITHPSFMPKLAPLAKILGPRGLMPNPKSGTISDKPEAVAKKLDTGTIKWKTEPKAGIIHQVIGKISAADENLSQNVNVLLASVGKQNIQSAYLTSTMRPSIQLELE